MFSKTDIENYFVAEKQVSGLFIIIGIVAICFALFFFFGMKTNFYKGAAIPFLLIGLLLGIVGFTIYKRSNEDRIRNVYAYEMNPQELKQKEIPRMETVMKSFVLYRYTHIILAIIGVGLFYYFKSNPDKTFIKGLAMALAIMAMVALFADYFAEKRGKIYLDGLRSFTEKIN